MFVGRDIFLLMLVVVYSKF